MHNFGRWDAANISQHNNHNGPHGLLSTEHMNTTDNNEGTAYYLRNDGTVTEVFTGIDARKRAHEARREAERELSRARTIYHDGRAVVFAATFDIVGRMNAGGAEYYLNGEFVRGGYLRSNERY